MQGETGWTQRVTARLGATSFGRSPETWRRRDSFLLAGLILVVDYFLIAIFLVIPLNTLGRIAMVVGTIPILAYTVAEAVQGMRPTPENLVRADRLALLATGTAATICVVVILVDLAASALGL